MFNRFKVAPEDLTRSRVQWELIDADGRGYNQGDGGAIEVRPSPIRPGVVIIRSDAEIGIPSNMPASINGSRYQIKWALLTPGRETQFSFDNFSIYPPEYERMGALDVVELFGTPSEASIRLPHVPRELAVELYVRNTKVAERLVTAQPVETSDGFLFVEQFDLMQMGGIGPSLVPINVVWRHREESAQPWTTETSSMWSVNPTILTAARDLEMFMNRAYIDSGIDPGTVFTQPDLLRHLRKGMDIFNSVVRPTNFTMTNAEGSIRQFWLAYSAVDGCRAQYLAEGMKTFNYGGSTVTLDVDRTTYWDSVASALQSETDQYVKPLKDNLAKWGVFGGDGSTPHPQVGSIGAIGISLSPITPLRQGYYRYFGTGVPFSL
jgi:hypothetical protein